MQRSFDDLGVPLHQVTFCVLDFETTGAAPPESAITEVGAVKLRGGECLGTFQTLVNPGVGIPPEITFLTGITEAMVLPAPWIEEVLPSFLEFLGDAVIVGHNVRFDMRFLQSALVSSGRAPVPNRVVDTCALARRLVRDEVPNCRLGTLADRLRLPHKPTHRALADALATGDLLHTLLERAGNLGVLGLDDLYELPTIRAHPQMGKLRLTSSLPRKPGVYLFKGMGGRVLYVGKATNLRARVRSYFGGDDRRKVSQMLRETVAIDHVVCAGTLEAAVLEVRLIHRHQPPFNHRSKLWSRYAYLKLTLNEAFPRLSVVRSPRGRRRLSVPRPHGVNGGGPAGRRCHRVGRADPPLHGEGTEGPSGRTVCAGPARRGRLPVRRHHLQGRVRRHRRPPGARAHRRPVNPVGAPPPADDRPGRRRPLRGGG